jgi:ATP-dependent DNA helicase RecQ
MTIDQADLLEVLKKYWGHSSFRPNQRDIIFSILAKKDTLAVLPTGGGKSVCFQVPALFWEGTCLVISPLIALMRDQVENLRKKGISAAALTSGMHLNETETILENFVNGHYKLLYISPERLQASGFQEYLKNAPLSFIAIDEAHCISQWGYDFRPAYLKISKIREFFPEIPFLALTASATPNVQKDIQEKLEFRSKNIFQGSFLRKNLSFSAFELEDKSRKMLDILRAVPGSAVVYVQTRKSAPYWASWLNNNSFQADYFHAGLSHKDRERKQINWIEGKTPILVATNAFGMGIDKGDVRSVIHVEVPSQPEAYYQEAGRAGRDGAKAFAIALFTRQELKDARKRIELNFPGPDTIRSIYEKLGIFLKLALGSGEMASFDFQLETFCKAFSLHPGPAYQALRKLEIAGYLAFNEAFYQPSRFHFLASPTALYDSQVRNPKIENLTKTLLRLYGGELFSDFVDIRETDIATLMKSRMEWVEKGLLELDTLGIGQYDPQKSKPQITFLTPRLEARNLDLDIRLLEQLKKSELARLETMEKYLLMDKGCRSVFLAEYFGEAAPDQCGICDLCLARKKKEKPAGIDYFRPIVLKDLKEPVNIREYENRFRPAQREDLRATIQFLLEEESLFFLSNGLLVKKGYKLPQD